MIIDFSSEYGVGYAVTESEEITEEDLEGGLAGYIHRNMGNNFESFKEVNAMIDDADATYLVIKNPFKNGLDLTEVKEELDNEIKRMNLQVDSEFGVVGGLYIC